MKNRYFKRGSLALVLLLTAALSACGKGAEEKAAAESPEAEASVTEAAVTEGSEGESSGEETGASPVITPFEDLFRDFSLQDLEGNEVTEAILSDCEVTMLNVWGTFCGPCLSEMPELGELNREYQEAGESFQVVGLVMDAFRQEEDGSIVADEEMVEKAKELAETTGADYLHIVPTGDFLYSLAASGETQAVPVTIFLDREGNIIDRPIAGARKKDNWKAVIDEKLEQAADE